MFLMKACPVWWITSGFQVPENPEKKTVWLRKMYADRDDLIENFDIIDEYIFDVMNICQAHHGYGCSLWFYVGFWSRQWRPLAESEAAFAD